MQLRKLYDHYAGYTILAVLVAQVLILRFAWQLESNDPLMGVGEAGFLLLPFSATLLVISVLAFQNRHWLYGWGALLLGLPGLLVASGSLYLMTL